MNKEQDECVLCQGGTVDADRWDIDTCYDCYQTLLFELAEVRSARMER